MKPLFFGLLAFGISFLIHVVWWRVNPPRRQTASLLRFLPAASAVFCLAFVPVIGFHGALKAFVLAASLSLAYAVTYSAVEAESPSLEIALLASRPQGFSPEELGDFSDGNRLVSERVADLEADGMVFGEGGKYKLTTKGFLLARLFYFHRKLSGLGKGG